MSLRNINIKKVIDKQVVKQDYKARLQKKRNLQIIILREKKHIRGSQARRMESLFFLTCMIATKTLVWINL